MKKKIGFFLLFLMLHYVNSFAQDEWKPQAHFTGYINSTVEYSDHSSISAAGVPTVKHRGIGLAQAAFVATYKPLEKLEIKSTLAYGPWTRSMHDVVVQAFGQYAFNQGFKLGAGKFLTPLSPSNLYYYAPLNPSGVLPMVVSHHMFFPQSISGIQIAGSFGENLKMNYNATYGNYYITDHVEGGIIGIQGQEEIAQYVGHYDVYGGNIPKSYLGGSGRLSFDFKEIGTLGLNIFEGTEANLVVLDAATGNVSSLEEAKQRSLGVDLHLNIQKFKLSAEYWNADLKTTKSTPAYSLVYKGYYGELIYDGGTFKPWVRYEYIEDAKALLTDGSLIDLPMTTYSGGIAYRPFYETIFKLEYRRILVEGHQQTSPNFKDYNYYLFSFVFSF